MNLEVYIEHESWDRAMVNSAVYECVSAVFSELRFTHDNVEICFLFTSDEEMRLLNKRYLGANKPTNVLSFPTNIYMSSDFKESQVHILGSIALAHQTLMQESKDQQKPFGNHLRHLIVHGVLHLFGYDHVKTQDAEKMESMEKIILAQLNVPDPYQ
jgi:probable rRNA maturation factor